MGRAIPLSLTVLCSRRRQRKNREMMCAIAAYQGLLPNFALTRNDMPDAMPEVMVSSFLGKPVLIREAQQKWGGWGVVIFALGQMGLAEPRRPADAPPPRVISAFASSTSPPS